ncbi:hypothetical protein D9619_010851 [Psilocybe cf. subviscida]|uniref:non-specific serine/threonine protein kinase n=1 Tax=Psilocybe cf. subviscida TaxID=2480587 RepID=A0A8H5B969_9AGAR|nr:hypothetical protein D9619_010851 [Psilocybe cf. subviscida]
MHSPRAPMIRYHALKYCALKVLSHEASHAAGPVREVDFLRKIGQKVAEVDDSGETCSIFFGLSDHVAVLQDDFFISGPPQSEGNEPTRHLCLVMHLYSTSVSALRRSSPTKALPIYMTRNIIYMLLQALVAVHAMGIVHTDVKLDNLLFIEKRNVQENVLEKYLKENPPVQDRDSGMLVQDEPIPSDWTFESSAHDFELSTIYLIDFGHAEWANEKPHAECWSPPSLRAPEVILGGEFGTALDIWAVGCLAFELLTGRWLFNPVDGEEDWTIEDDHLAKMQELTGQQFSEAVLARAARRDEYFDKRGNLLRIPDLIPVSIEQAIENYNVPGVIKEQIGALAEFIRDCLNLDPAQRKTAGDLQNHGFFNVVGPC